MKRWQGSCIGALLVLLVCGSSMVFIVPVGGAMLVGIPPVFDALTGWVVCPNAVSIEQEEYNQGPVTTSPTGGGRGIRRNGLVPSMTVPRKLCLMKRLP